jgi:hypothetical protein
MYFSFVTRRTTMTMRQYGTPLVGSAAASNTEHGGGKARALQFGLASCVNGERTATTKWNRPIARVCRFTKTSKVEEWSAGLLARGQQKNPSSLPWVSHPAFSR